jgi:hypothetical protein
MRPGQQKQRGRGRNTNNNNNGGNNNNFNRKGGNPLTRSYDSSGPDVKIRGTAQHIAEKYATLARDAQSSGDRVVAENYLQHAEHYNRIIAAAQAQMQERLQRDERSDYGNDRDGEDFDSMDGDENGNFQNEYSDEGNNQERTERQVRPERQDRSERQERPERQQERPERADKSDRPERTERPERNDRRERFEQRRQERPQRQPRPEPTEQPIVVESDVPVRAKPQTVYDASNEPQPIIEGTPVEVVVEVESQADEGAATTRAPRRARTATPRPRRPRRAAGEEGENTEAAADPVVVGDAAE